MSDKLSAGKAVHAITLGGELPEWVQLLPAGTFQGRDGRGPYHNNDPELVIAETRSRNGMDLPIDYGHALEEDGVKGSGAPAAGWIKDFEVRNEGEIWGRVAWSGRGAEAVQGHEFRYLSPVFYHAQDGTVHWILRAGLTNRPNLHLMAVNSKQAGDAAGQEDDVADEKKTLSPVATALGLGEDADQEAILQRCSQATAAQQGLSKVAQSLDLKEDASADDVIAAITTKSKVDPEQYVPRAQHDALATQLRTAQAANGEREVDAAIEAGKITPAQRQWALDYHSSNPAGFASYVETAPVIVDTKKEKPGSHDGKQALTEDAKTVASRLGITDESAFAKNLETT